MNDYGNALRTQRVHSVGFGLLNPRDLVEQSVCEVNTYISNIKETSIDEGSVLDPRMGTTTKTVVCSSCCNTYNECPGHFGHIVLAKPVYNIMFLPFILKIMKTTCANCGYVLAGDALEDVLRVPAKSRLAYLTTLPRTTTTCRRCNALQPKYTMYKNEYIRIQRYDRRLEEGRAQYETVPVEMTAADVLAFLQRIPDEQCAYYGMDPRYARPEWMIWTVLPVPPPAVRMILSTGYNSKPSIDDLTVALNTDIVKINEELRDMLRHRAEGDTTVTDHKIAHKWDILQNSINQYVNNEGMRTRLQHKNGRLMKSIVERLKTKKGLVRNNLEGKRVNESARSVVTCDPDLDIDQVGVPRKIAVGLSFPETVNAYNIAKMRVLVRNGPFRYPGARSVRTAAGGKLFALVTRDQCARMADELRYGDIVNRNLVDNDLVMLNRQPSLHRMNIMAHRVKVLDFDTFRINPNVTTPYNADFDGDEMNIFCVTNYLQLAELKYMMHVSTQFISPQINLPIIGTVQDSTLAPYLLTREEGDMAPNVFQDLLGAVFTNNLDALDLRRVKQTRRAGDLLTLLFPPSFSYTSRNFAVTNGAVVPATHTRPATIDKSNLVANNYNTFFHCAFNTLGAGLTNQMFNSFAKLANAYFVAHGFTTGIRDCIPPADFTINDQLAKYDEDVKRLTQLICDTPRAGRFALLNSYRFDPAKTAKWKNLLNLSDEEIFEAYPTFVQNLWSAYSVEVDKRVNAAYEHSDLGMARMIYSGSKGSKKNLNSIIALLGQQDVEGHWILEELNHRTLPHFPKDTDLPATHGFITHGYYGGLDPVEYYFQAIAGRFSQMLKSIKTADTGYFQRCFIKMFENIFAGHDGSIRNSFGGVIEYLYGGDGFNVNNLIRVDISELDLHLPLARVQQVLYDAPGLVNIQKQLHAAIHAAYVRMRRYPDFVMLPVDVRQAVKEHGATFSSAEIEVGLSAFFGDLQATYGSDFWKFYPKLAIIALLTLHHRANPAVLGVISRTLHRSTIKATENIGIIMAQSIGQPTTQMSLNAFHNSGRSTAVTSGVPRLKELVRLSAKIATPSMNIVVRGDAAAAQFIKANISEVTVRRVLRSPHTLHKTRAPDGTPRFVLRLAFGRFDMLFNSVTVMDIDVALRQACASVTGLTAETKWTYLPDGGDLVYTIEFALRAVSADSVADAQFISAVGHLAWVERIINDRILPARIHGFGGVRESELVRAAHRHATVVAVGGGNDGVAILPPGNDTDATNVPDVVTTGTDLLDVLALFRHVDRQLTITNDVIEIYRLMGIEAARAAMLHEIDIVMNSESDSIDRRHLEMLVDVMTHPGFMISMDRHGMIKSTSAPLQRASFEETTKQIITAAMFNESDPMNSISSNIMFGQVIPTGTGACRLRLNMNKFAKVWSSQNVPAEKLTAAVTRAIMPVRYFNIVLDADL